jgi:hypothetical protein
MASIKREEIFMAPALALVAKLLANLFPDVLFYIPEKRLVTTSC